MTAQAPDVLTLDNTDYVVSHAKGVGLFDPRDLGIETSIWRTNLSRGYINHYEIDAAAQLNLRELWLCPRNLPPPAILGASPQAKNGMFTYHPRGQQISFTGAMLICLDPVEHPRGTDGTIAPWNYLQVLELAFQEGRLTARWDHSRDIQALAARETPRIHDPRTLDLLRSIYRSPELKEPYKPDPTLVSFLRSAFRRESGR